MLLLLLRCLLLALIAMALAGPQWRSLKKNNAKGWVLMSRTALPGAYQRFEPLVDSLLQAGFEFHYFEAGFPKLNFETALHAVKDSIAIKQPSYRCTVELLNEQVPAHLPLYVFTDNFLRNFGGPRSRVSLNLRWFTYTPPLLPAIVADSSGLRVTIFNHGYGNDARYLKAALDALQQFTKKNIIVQSVTAISNIPDHQDWLFWLANEPVVNDLNATNILQYAIGKPLSVQSYILPAAGAMFDAVSLYMSVPDTTVDTGFADIRWKDGFGNPLLVAQKKKNTNHYRLYTHFDPAWNELPWSGSFPQIVYGLIQDAHTSATGVGSTDQTIIDSTQLMPVLLTGKDADPKPAIYILTPLSGICWLLVFLLFFTERWFSFYHRKTAAHG